MSETIKGLEDALLNAKLTAGQYNAILTALETFRALEGLKYYINNPSAWDDYDDGMSERLRKILETAEIIEAKK